MRTATIAVVVGLLALGAWGSCRRNLPKVTDQPPKIWLASAPPTAPAARTPPAAKPRPRKPKPAAKKQAPDRFELVRPAPEGFVPEPGRALKLTLIPERTFVSRGRSFWYRLELQNAGREPFLWREDRSFFEDGFLQNSDVQFFVTQPDGHEVRMLPPLDDPGRSAESNGIEVNLSPGETLVSRPWAYQGRGAGATDSVWGPFRELATRYDFAFLGGYRIKAVLTRPELGKVESNEVAFEVVP